MDERGRREQRRTVSGENLVNSSFQRKERTPRNVQSSEVIELQEIIKRLASDKALLQAEIHALKQSKPAAFSSTEINLVKEKALLYQEKEELLKELKALRKSDFKEKYFQAAKERDQLRAELSHQSSLLGALRKNACNTEQVDAMKERILSLQAEVETLRTEIIRKEGQPQVIERNFSDKEIIECASEIGNMTNRAVESQNIALMKLKFLSSLEFNNENRRKLGEILSHMENQFRNFRETASSKVNELQILQAKAEVLSDSHASVHENPNSQHIQEEVHRLSEVLEIRERENEAYRRELEKYKAAHEKNMQVLNCLQSQMVSFN